MTIESNRNRVADAVPNSWVYRLLPASTWPYAQLARWDRPIGWWLLLWPCWWSLATALAFSAEFDARWWTGTTLNLLTLLWESVPYFIYFLIGAIAMRGAGCTYNDMVDRQIDAQVARTASRPIPSGRVTVEAALIFLIGQALVGFVCLLLLTAGPSHDNWFALMLGLASLLVVACYPFAKRVSHWPQFVLGLAFSWGALMGWAVIFDGLSVGIGLLYAGCVLWTIGYDTIYAHQDREDDALVGIGSTALLFGEHTKTALMVLYAAALALIALSFFFSGPLVSTLGERSLGWPAFAGIAAGAVHMLWQIRTLDIQDADNCLRLFKSNRVFGWIIFAGLIADIFL